MKISWTRDVQPTKGYNRNGAGRRDPHQDQVANIRPLPMCYLIVRSVYHMMLTMRFISITSGYIAGLFSSIRSNLFLSFLLRYEYTFISSPETSFVSGAFLLREENCPQMNSFLLSVKKMPTIFS